MATLKQQAAFDKLMENTAKPVSEVMLEVGYDPDTAKNPHQLLESKGFLQLLETHGLDDESLAAKHKELLDSDHTIAIKALDMAYKVKDHYAVQKTMNLNATVTGDIKDFEKYRELKAKYEAELLNTLQSD